MNKKKLKVKRLVILLCIIICVIGLVYSVYNIIKWKLENNKVEEIQETIKESITIEEPIEKGEKSILDRYSVDFDELKKVNSEVVGYIKVENTNIESTIVKHNDNSYYLNHSFDKKWNTAGWIFAHYKNKYDGTDRNYVIFGHARKDGSMFGTLKNIFSKEWLDANNKVIFITENSKSIYEVFSVYQVEAEEYYINTDLQNDKEYEEFINKVKSRSLKDFNVEVTTADRLLTLSTCDDSGQYRVVLHAKEIKGNTN